MFLMSHTIGLLSIQIEKYETGLITHSLTIHLSYLLPTRRDLQKWKTFGFKVLQYFPSHLVTFNTLGVQNLNTTEVNFKKVFYLSIWIESKPDNSD